MPSEKDSDFRALVIEYVAKQRRTTAIIRATLYFQTLWLIAITSWVVTR